jgi:hypothetical protein
MHNLFLTNQVKHFHIKKWLYNGMDLRVHISEFDPKHPQLEPKPTTADGQGLRNARPQIFTQASGDGGFMNVDLTLPAPFAFRSNSGMVPDNGSAVNARRQATITLGRVTVTT